MSPSQNCGPLSLFSRIPSFIWLLLAFSLWGCSDDSPASPEEPDPTPRPPASIELSSPPRGGMVQSGTLDDSPITLNGTACDSVSTVSSLTIGGQPVPLTGVPPCLDFTAQTSSRWGLNVVSGTAHNTGGGTRAFAQSYLRSPSYYLPATTLRSTGAGAEAEKVRGGYTVQLNQTLIDDGNRSDADDFTTLANLALSTMDLDDVISNPLASLGGVQSTCDCIWPLDDIDVRSTGYRINAGTITGGQPSVQYANLTDGGIAMRFQIAAISVPVSVNGFLNPTCAVACATRIVPNETVHGTVTAPMFTFDPIIHVSLGSNGRPQVSVTVDASGFEPSLNINWGLLEFLDGPIGLSAISNLIIDYFESGVEEVVEDVAAEELEAVMNAFLASFELPSSISLPPPTSITLNVASEYDAIDFDAMSHLRLGFAVAVSPEDPLIASPLGSIRCDGSVPTFSPTGYGIGVGLKDDLVNQILWAAWQGGAFDNVSPTSGCSAGGAEVRVSLTPPPVMMPGSGGSPVEVGLGDAYVDAGASAGGDVGLFASTIAGATVGLQSSGDHLTLAVESNQDIAVQIVTAPDNADFDALTAQYGPVAKCALSEILGQIFASIPLPSPAIGQFGLPGLPANARWVLSGAAVERQASCHTFAGNVIVQ